MSIISMAMVLAEWERPDWLKLPENNMPRIENDELIVSVQEKGAELISILHKGNSMEYMWSGDPNWWGKHSPVLFPIVGTLKDNRYHFAGREYNLPRHGFARDKTFILEQQDSSSLTMLLKSDKSTHANYPFDFEFRIRYSVSSNQLKVEYQVFNPGSLDMYFSVGAHPAFKLPLVEGTLYDDYWLEFNYRENSGRWPISAEGLIESNAVPLLHNSNKLPLHKSLFYKDAIVLKDLNSNEVKLCSSNTSHGFVFSFEGFPYLGIWAAKNADFLCIEPWCGIADSVNANQQLKDKEGIIRLLQGETFVRSWSVEVY